MLRSKALRLLYKQVLLIILIISLLLSTPIILLSFLLRPFCRKKANHIATISSYIIWTVLHWMFMQTARIKAPEIPEDNYLVISNHTSAIDFAFINSVNKHRFSHSKYAFKKTLRFVPLFYQAFLALNYLVLSRSFEQDQKRIHEYVKELKKYNYPVWFVLFCEGTRFKKEKLDASNEFCRKRGIEPFRNVLMPRHKGFSIIHRELRGSQIKKVLDLTFYVEKGHIGLMDLLFSGKVYNLRCDARVVDLDQIEDGEKFIVESFRRKDELIENWKNRED